MKCAVLLYVLLAGPLYACSAMIPQFPVTKEVQDLAWRTACTLSAYSCRGVKPPPVVIELLSQQPLFYDGMYLDGRVALRAGMRPDEDIYDFAVLVHEFVHHLQYQHGAPIFYGSHDELCRYEAEAYAVSEKLLREAGREPWEWRPSYGC